MQMPLHSWFARTSLMRPRTITCAYVPAFDRPLILKMQLAQIQSEPAPIIGYLSNSDLLALDLGPSGFLCGFDGSQTRSTDLALLHGRFGSCHRSSGSF